MTAAVLVQVIDDPLPVLIEKFNSFNAKLVFGAECNCFPAGLFDNATCFGQPAAQSPYRFLNSGTIMGKAQHLLAALNGIRDEVCMLCANIHVCTAVYLNFGLIGQNFTASVTEANARRPGAAASVSRRRRERRTLLAGGGRRASHSHTLAASQAFERMHMLFCHRVKTEAHDGT